jgi:hypothetical protein
MVKFEEFHQSNYVLKINEILANESLMNKLQSFYNSLPSKLKRSLKDYFNGKVDLNLLYKYEKKFNIFEKVKNLYNKGIKNVNDIIDRIFPKNEEIAIGLFITLGILTTLIVMGLLIWGLVSFTSSNTYDRWSEWACITISVLWVLTIVGMFTGGIIGTAELSNRIEKRQEFRAKFDKETAIKNYKMEVDKLTIEYGVKADTIMLVRDALGNYKVEIKGMDETEW